MKQTINSLLFATVMGTAILAGCVKGDQGDPWGPAGNANVIGTNTVTIYPGEWTVSSSDYYYKNLIISAITPDVVDFGAVFVYYEVGTNEWMMLPNLTGPQYIQNIIHDNGVTIEVSTVDGFSVVINSPMTFRVVIIPSNIRKANPDTNWSNYKEVEQLIKQQNTVKRLN